MTPPTTAATSFHHRARRAPRSLRGRAPWSALLLAALAACGGPDEPETAPAPAGPPDAELTAGDRANPFEVPERPRGLRIANPMDPERDYNFDLGRVPYGSVQVVDVELENVEPTPLSIRAVKPGCGCTVPSITYTRADGEVVRGNTRAAGPVIAIPPGRHADLRLEIDTRNVDKKNQSKRVLVRITSEAEGADEVFYTTLEIHLIVDLPFVAVPGRLDMKRVPRSGGGVAMVEITRANYDGLSLGEIVSSPDDVLCDLRNEQRFGHDVWTLTARLLPPVEQGLFQGEVVIAVVDSEGEPTGRTFTVPIQAQAVADVQVIPSRLTIPRRALERGPSATSELATLLPGHRLQVVASRLEGQATEHLRLTVEPLRDGGSGATVRATGADRWRIVLEPLATLDVAEFEGVVVLELDDPQFPEIRVPYSGAVLLD